jgi:hypothetical protein
VLGAWRRVTAEGERGRSCVGTRGECARAGHERRRLSAILNLWLLRCRKCDLITDCLFAFVSRYLRVGRRFDVHVKELGNFQIKSMIKSRT